MSNWTIGKKIAAGFLAVLMLAISVGLYAVWKSAEADHRVNLVASQYLPEAELAAALERDLLNARIHFIYFVTVQKPGSLEKGWARFHNAQQELPKLMAVVERSDAFAAIRPDAEQHTEQSTKVKTLVGELNMGSQEQARGIEQISKAVVQIEQVTQKTAATAAESASAAEELNAQSGTLNELVARLSAMVDGSGTEGAA